MSQWVFASAHCYVQTELIGYLWALSKSSVIDTDFIDQSIRREIIFTSPYCKKSDFSQMWNNLSINTSFSNIIEIDRLLKEGLTLEEE